MILLQDLQEGRYSVILSASYCLDRTSCIPSRLLPLILALDTTEKILSLSSSHLLKKILSNIDNITFELPLLQAKLLQVSQPLLKGEILQSLYHLLGGPLLDSFQYTHVSLILGSLELYIVLQMKSN